MKIRKLFITILFSVVFCSLFTQLVFAWAPDSSFYCITHKEKIPKGTMYIDLLLPISATDAYYVDYNMDNCKVYGISETSEIVSYNTDGYMSYTFHINDAYSQMRPEVACSFNIKETAYNKYSKILSMYDDYRRSEPFYDEYIHYSVHLYLYSNEYVEFQDNVSEVELIDYCETPPSVKFNSEVIVENNICVSGRKSECNYNYCRKHYKTLKFAYLDSEGNILDVSNAVSISKSTSSSQLGLELTGTVLTCNIEDGPPYWIIGVIMIMEDIVICSVILVGVIFLIKWICRKRKRFD